MSKIKLLVQIFRPSYGPAIININLDKMSMYKVKLSNQSLLKMSLIAKAYSNELFPQIDLSWEIHVHIKVLSLEKPFYISLLSTY